MSLIGLNYLNLCYNTDHVYNLIWRQPMTNKKSKAESKKKNPGGRPPFKITPEILQKVEQLAAQGMTLEQISDCLGIAYCTLNEKSKEYVEFSDAIKLGKARGIAMVTNALLKNVSVGNTAAQIFFLKARAKWREQDMEDLANKNKPKTSEEIMQEFLQLKSDEQVSVIKKILENQKSKGK